jgi:hypothetical protein
VSVWEYDVARTPMRSVRVRSGTSACDFGEYKHITLS